MSPSIKVTERDVARLHRGDIEDLTEIERVLHAIEEDPKLDLVLQILEGPDEPPPSVPRFPPLPDLRNTRLCRIRPVPELATFADGGSCETQLEVEVNGQIESYDVRLEQGEGRIRVVGNWPSHLKPVGLVLGDFNFELDGNGERRIPFRDEVNLPKPAIPENSQDATAGTSGRSGLRSFTASARSSENLNGTESSGDFFSATVNKDGTLSVSARPPENLDEETVLVEVSTNDTKTCQPVTVHRKNGRRLGHARTDFPWPTGLKGKLIVRAMTNEEVPRLNAEQVFGLLANPERFVAVPVTDLSDGFSLELRYEFDRTAASNASNEWFVEVEEGGAA